MVKTKFAINLIEARKQSGLTQTEAADRMEIKRPTLASYEEGRAEPCLKIFFKICEFYCIKNISQFAGEGDFVAKKQPELKQKEKILSLARQIVEQLNPTQLITNP